jgi:hypothetical protein
VDSDIASLNASWQSISRRMPAKELGIRRYFAGQSKYVNHLSVAIETDLYIRLEDFKTRLIISHMNQGIVPPDRITLELRGCKVGQYTCPFR